MDTTDTTNDGYTKPRTLNREDYKTLGLSSLGGTLEFYDFVIYAFYAKTVIAPLFFSDQMTPFMREFLTWGLFAAGYLVRPVGGIIMAHFGDIIGRKRMFTLSIAMMALPTLIIGLLPTYESIGIIAPLLLLVMRMLQGAAIGGEMPGAWVFIAEHTPHQRKSLGIGVLTSGITGGILLGSIVTIIIEYFFVKQEILDYAWRIPFILGGVFGVISVYLRRFLSETPIFKEMAQKKTLSKELPVKTVVKNHKLAVILVGLLTWSLSTTIVVGILMTPESILGGMYQIPAMDYRIANCFAAFMLSIGCVLVGWMDDKLGTRVCAAISWSALIASSFYFYNSLSAGISTNSLILNYGLMGLCAGAISMTAMIGTRVFPPAIRFSGLSFSYNISYAIFSAVTPILTLTLLDHSHLGAAFYISLVAVLAIILCFIPLSYRGLVNQKDVDNSFQRSSVL